MHLQLWGLGNVRYEIFQEPLIFCYIFLRESFRNSRPWPFDWSKWMKRKSCTFSGLWSEFPTPDRTPQPTLSTLGTMDSRPSGFSFERRRSGRRSVKRKRARRARVPTDFFNRDRESFLGVDFKSISPLWIVWRADELNDEQRTMNQLVNYYW